MQVRGFSKKGRQFYNISTFMTEPIHSMFVHGTSLHLAGDHLYTHYVDSKEQPVYISQATIQDMCPVRVRGLGDSVAPVAVLSCGDRALRAVVGNEIGCVVSLEASPTALCPLSTVSGGVVYGTADGQVGAVALERESHTVLWTLDDDGGGTLGAVTTIAEGHVGVGTDPRVLSLVVGHECGTVRVIHVHGNDPEVRARVSMGSAVTSVAVGNFSTESFPDVIVATYSGSIVGLTAVASHSEHVASTAAAYARRVDALNAEIIALEKQLGTVQSASIHDGAGPAVVTGSTTEVNVRDSFALVESDVAYLLTIELPVSIELVVFWCDVQSSIQVGRGTDAVAVFNSPESGEPLIASHRCAQGTTRLEILVHSIEGEHGSLEVSVFPNNHPKLCWRRHYPLCALSLHQRVSDGVDETLPLSTLVLRGGFSTADFLGWLGKCFADVAPRMSGDRAVLVYRSMFVETQVEVAYENGSASLRSDCLSTLAILRDTISREATLSNTPIRMSSTPDFTSVEHCLRLFVPRFIHHRRIAQQHFVLEQLRELISHEGNDDFVTPAQRVLLENAEGIALEHAARPHHLHRLHDMVVRLYADKCNFQRRNPTGQAHLAAALNEDAFVDASELIALFEA